MKIFTILLILALSTAVFAGIIAGPYHTPNPNHIWKKVYFGPLRTLDYAGIHLSIQNPKSKLILLTSISATTALPITKSNFCILVSPSCQSGDVDTLPSV